jgi:ABC-type nitrate/sulfonate/bicarbonate transport system substrate-binding protein
MIDENPDLCALMVKTHAAATDYLRAHPAEWAAATSKTWGAAIEAVELAIRNIPLRWRIDDAYVDQSRVLGEQLESLKQVKKQPDYLTFFDMRFARSLPEASL